MKLRVIATLVAALALSANVAFGQSIGVFGDLTGASCNITVPGPGMGVGTAFILALKGGPSAGGITGAEVRVTGVPGTILAFWSPNPAANALAGVSPSDASGMNIAFPSCQMGAGPTLLWTGTLINAGFAGTATFGVTSRVPVGNPNFVCPAQFLCDAPMFTEICVGGGEAFVNDSRNCNVAVEATSWSALKGLYSSN